MSSEPLREHFFRESWEDSAAYQSEGHGRQEDIGAKEAWNAYLAMKKVAEISPLAAKIFEVVQKAILRYLYTIDQLSKKKLEDSENRNSKGEDRGEADTSRQLAHNALIANLDALARLCIKQGIDNGWRNMIGLDRKEVTIWVLQVGSLVSKDIIENNRT